MVPAEHLIAGKRAGRERLIRALLLCATVVSSGAILAIFLFLVYFSASIFLEGQFTEVFSWQWMPIQKQYGILSVMVGSIALSATTMLVAYPFGLGLCCFVHGAGPPRLARPLMGLVHFMTSVPTVVYGFVSVFLLVPLVRSSFEEGTGFSWLAASLTLSILVLPTIVLLIHTQMDQVSPGVRLASKALGLSPAQELLHVVLPLCSRGLAAGAVLGFGRAVGDTIIALMLAGNAAQIPHSLLDSIRVLTAHIALVLATDVHSAAYHSLFACGLILFAMTAGVNLAIRAILARSPSGTGGFLE